MYKAKERIAPILQVLQNKKIRKEFLELLLKPDDNNIQLNAFETIPYLNIEKYLGMWELLKQKVEEYWMEYPEYRLTQVLLATGVLNGHLGDKYYVEEIDFFINKKYVDPREVCVWGQNYDVDNNLLNETRYILIKDMSTDHIEAILDLINNKKIKVGSRYLKTFKDELKLRA